MQTFEFETTPSPDGSLPVPAAVRQQLHGGQTVRVIVMVDEEATDWAQATAREFLQGYASDDALYDDVEFPADGRR